MDEAKEQILSNDPTLSADSVELEQGIRKPLCHDPMKKLRFLLSLHATSYKSVFGQSDKLISVFHHMFA